VLGEYVKRHQVVTDSPVLNGETGTPDAEAAVAEPNEY
jgi:hypothetical protein